MNELPPFFVTLRDNIGGASVAQWIERWTHDLEVGGSNPARPFGFFLVRFQSSFSRSSSSFNK